MIKTLVYFVQSFVVYFFYFVGKLLGLNLSRKLFSTIFLILGPLFKSNEIIDTNLNTFKADLTKPEKNKIISNMWNNYGKTFIEYIFLGYFKKNNKHIQIIGEKHLESIIETNRPAIFISGHFANFELMSMEITKKNIKLATIYRPLNNFFLNPFMEFLREKYVCKNQIKKGIKGVREAIEFIKNETSIALMIDQRLSEGEKINFFGKPALTTTLPAQLSMKYDLPIIPVFIQRTEDDKFIIEFFEEINSKNFKDKNILTKKLNETLESMIIKNPNQWIWTHNRWK